MSLRQQKLPRHNAGSLRNFMLFISIQDLEAAINYWRERSPATGEALELCKEASALANIYALMIIQSAQRVPLENLSERARLAWDAYLLNKDQDVTNK